MKRRKTRATIIATGIRKKKRVNPSMLRSNQKLILLTTLFVCGMLLGILFVKHTSAEMVSMLQNLVDTHFKEAEAQSVLMNFLTTLGAEGIYLLLAVLCGLCIVGEPILWLLPVGKGLGLGVVSASLYKIYTLQGLEYYALFLLAPAVLSTAALLFGCKESILFSRDMNRSLFKKTDAGFGIGALKLYALRHIVLFVILIFAASISAVLMHLFHGSVSLFSA